MSRNMGIHIVSQKNTFWSICISALISFLRFYGVTSTDKSKFQPNYSIPYAIRFQKMWILWVVQFITEKPLPNELWVILIFRCSNWTPQNFELSGALANLYLVDFCLIRKKWKKKTIFNSLSTVTRVTQLRWNLYFSTIVNIIFVSIYYLVIFGGTFIILHYLHPVDSYFRRNQ